MFKHIQEVFARRTKDTPEAKYSELRDLYLNGDMSPSDFLDEYRNVDNYKPESPDRNRSHMDE